MSQNLMHVLNMNTLWNPSWIVYTDSNKKRISIWGLNFHDWEAMVAKDMLKTQFSTNLPLYGSVFLFGEEDIGSKVLAQLFYWIT